MATSTPPGNVASRRRKFLCDNSIRVFPRSPSARPTSHQQLKSASSRISSSSSSSTSSSSFLSSASSRRSNIPPATSLYRPSSGVHYLSWFVPRYLVGSAEEGGCKPLLPVEGEVNLAKENNNRDDLNEREVPSPLHSSRKMAWLSTHTNNDLSSLPFPPAFHPNILDYPSPHADNLSQAFRRSWPPVNFYCRHACPCAHHCWPPPPSLLPLPAAASGQPPPSSLLPPPPSLLPLPAADSGPPPPPSLPPPQGVFTNVGVAPRRHFTVHPDWRRVRHW